MSAGLPDAETLARLTSRLLAERTELAARVGRIHAHARDGLAADSREQAEEVGRVEVVSALEAEAVAAIAAIDAALERVEAGTFGTCVDCGEPIAAGRLAATPAAARCTPCQAAADG